MYVLFDTFERARATKVVAGSYPPKLWAVCRFLLLALAGLPPLSVFFLKRLIFASLLTASTATTPAALLAVVGTVVSVFYYLTFIAPRFLVH